MKNRNPSSIVALLAVLTALGCSEARDGTLVILDDRPGDAGEGPAGDCVPGLRTCADAEAVLECAADGRRVVTVCAPGQVCLEGACAAPAPNCGDGVVEPGEGCDPGLMARAPCDQIDPRFVAGEAVCTAACTISTAACVLAEEAPEVECPTEGQAAFGRETAEPSGECDGRPAVLAGYAPDHPVTVRIYAHVAMGPDGEPAVTPEGLRRIFDDAQAYWDDGQVELSVVNLDDPLEVPEAYFDLSSAAFDGLIQFDNQPDGLDAYFVNDFEDLCGRAAGIGHSAAGDGVVVDVGCGGATLAHEIGHLVGLWHTHRGFDPAEADCHTQGDLCCDTPPDPGSDDERDYHCTVPDDSICDTPTCEGPDGPILEEDPPDVFNRMSYYGCGRDPAVGVLSTDQYHRARCYLDTQYGHALGPDSRCPAAAPRAAALEARVLDVITLDAGGSRAGAGPDGAIVEHRWTVISRPEGSSARPVEAFYDPRQPANGGREDDPATPTAALFLDTVGTYEVELTVVTAGGFVAPGDECPQPPARVRIDATPDQGVTLQLVWDTPGDPETSDDDGTDLDLMLRHPAAESWDGGWVCSFRAPNPDWGRRGDASDDPSLDIDDTDGAGPEILHLPDAPGSRGGPYRVGVLAYRSVSRVNGGDFGASIATASIYVGEALIARSERVLDAGELWIPFEFSWAGDGVGVRHVDDVVEDHGLDWVRE